MILQHDYIDLDVDEINDHPIQFDIELSNKTYSMVFKYNSYADCYYCSLYDAYDVPLVMSEKLVYGMALFENITDPRLPLERLIPLDESNTQSEVNKETFGKTVFLVFDDDFDVNNDNADDIGDDNL
ncbi:phage baseplate plug family protein [Apilactobacillus micheneri]|uniref:phage baseplate plug family protein n=1 Tax=Apilactobacillus micheneri TaxID=1899430 RepID=UPI000D038073|nr:hypothetical protein [Apilactobacillus micheneri]